MSYESISGSLGKSFTDLRKNKPWYKEKQKVCVLSLLIILCLTGIIIGSVLFGLRRSAPQRITCQKSNETTICFFVFFDLKNSTYITLLFLL